MGTEAGAAEGAYVAALHLYPVKSLAGQQVEHLELDERGCVGDRVWSVRTTDNKIGSGKTTRRFAAVGGLLLVRAAESDGRVVLTFPDGSCYDVEDPRAGQQLSSLAGQPLTLARETDVSHFDDGPVSLIGSGSIRAFAAAREQEVDPLRFRANILLEGTPALQEDEWLGRKVRLGEAVLEVTMQSPRCVMIDMATADLPEQPGNLLAVGRFNQARLGVIARVAEPGRISVGDPLTVL